MYAEPLQLCFVCLQARGSFLPGQGKVGGAERQVQLIADYLAAQPGFAVHVIVEDSGQPAREQVGAVTLHRLDQPPARRDPLGRAWRLGASALGLARLARRLRAAVYVQPCAGAETGIIEHAAHAVGARFAFWMASDSECDPPWSAGGGLSGRLFRRGLARADAILAQHELQQARIAQVYRRESYLLPNVFDFARVLREQPLPPPAERRRALWVGRASRIKGPHRFIELARRLPECAFTMIAPPAENELDYWAELQAALPAVANLEFIPGLPPDKLGPHYARAGVLVNTSDFEGMPNTFLEAAARELALASLHADPAGLLSGEDRAGLWMGGDFEKLVAMTRGLLTDDLGRSRWGLRARELFTARHELATIGPPLAHMLRELAATPPRKAHR